MTTWYGKSTVKELDLLLEKKPKLQQLLLTNQFLTELKAFNSKLLDYVSSTPTLLTEMVELITVPPSYNDSEDRKYKLPLLSIEMLQTQTTCVLNNFFKETNKLQPAYFDTLFYCLNDPEILPILGGYLFRVNLCLMNNRQKQTLQRVYANSQILNKLVNHANHMSITNILQLFLNLDSNKNQGMQSQQKLKVKISILNLIIAKIKTQNSMRSQDSNLIIENLCTILLQTIQKYYLIIDGKQMMEFITSQKVISVMMTLMQSNTYDHAFSACNFFISLINYYSFSSFNSDDINSESGKKNLQRLQSQPMIIQLTAFFSTAVDKIMKAQSINLYYYRLLEVLCHCISISSLKIFECIKKTNFFSCLLKLLFNHEKNNILHMLIEKSFLHLFISDRKIYNQYKRHLFCEIDIIDCTAGTLVKMFPTEQMFGQAKKKAYFGHFMRILKIYSGIQTLDEDIVNAIKAKTELWNKITKNLIVPYQNIYEQKLGSFQNTTQPIVQQFKIAKTSEIASKPKENNVVIKQIEEEENVPKMKSQISSEKQEELKNSKNQIFNKTPINSNFISTIDQNNDSSAKQRPHYLSQSNIVDYGSNDKELKKSQSFKQFMHKKKAQAQSQLKIKRSLSQQRRLSGQKAKIISNSPSKKNSWRQDTNEDKQKKEEKKQQNIPKIPLNKKNGLNISSVSERRSPPVRKEDLDERVNKSMMNMSELKKIKVFQIEKPKQKKFRRIEDKDKLLLQFLGLPA